jgi:hypothetical protein
MPRIKGGYYIKAKRIQKSEIAHAPPHVREIWDWLLMQAKHEEEVENGYTLRRGQVLCTYKDVQEGLHWLIGYRKMTYQKHHIETATRWLTKHDMIHTQKTTRGIIITINKYSHFQNPENYKKDNETDSGTYSKPTREQKPYNKELKRNNLIINNKKINRINKFNKTYPQIDHARTSEFTSIGDELKAKFNK